MALTYRHSFNSGDLISALPGIQKLYKETGKKAIIYQRIDFFPSYDHTDYHPIKNEDGKQVCMNKKTFEFMKPLLESQEYVEAFKIWNGEDVDFNLEETRTKNREVMSGGLIHYWPFLSIPELECDLSIPWLKVNPIKGNSICINFTERYRNPKIHYIFLSEYEKDIIFVGLKHEYEIFCEQWRLNIKYVEVENFLQLAQIISGCRFFMGCQSFCWHLADAMKKRRILEVCYLFPNTFPTGANGSAFLKQEPLEYLFNSCLKQTE